MVYKSDLRGSRPVRLVAVHTAEGSRTAASLAAYFYSPAVQASSHVGIDAGATLQYVGYDRAAWTLRSGNAVSDNAELCAFAHFTREQWLSTGTVEGCVNPRGILDRTAAWIRSRCLARNIPIRKLTPAQVAAGMSGVIAHWDWTIGMHDGTHTDPGANFPWDYVIGKAQQSEEKDWLTMATPKELEEAVFNGNRRVFASDEIRGVDSNGRPTRNMADGVLQTAASVVGIQGQLDRIIDGQRAQATATNNLADAIREWGTKP